MEGKKLATKHQFAFYVSGLGDLILSLCAGETLEVIDKNLFHRLSHVTRLDSGNLCVFFDRQVHTLVELLMFEGKKKIVGRIIKKEENKSLQPFIVFLLPLLKREHFQTALYSLAELGVNKIQPVLVDKAQRKWGGEKEFERSQKILIAAAEQSKNFSFPELLEPKSLQDCCKEFSDGGGQKFFFDPQGDRLAGVLPKFQDKNFTLLIGPEGDLIEAEKNILKANDFLFCSLTPTVLRAVQAAAVSVGIFRTFFRS